MQIPDRLSKKNSTLYSIICLNNCILKLCEHLRKYEGVSGDVKYRFTIFENAIKALHRDILNAINDATYFKREFTDKDVEVFGSVFFSLIEMDEGMRQQLEHFAAGLITGECRVEYEDK